MIVGEQAVAQVVDVHDDNFGLPVTSGAVGVLEGGSSTPGNTLYVMKMTRGTNVRNNT